jgi:hypothetical protein
MWRDDQLDGLAHRLATGIAEQRFGVRSPIEDAAGCIDGERCAGHDAAPDI